MTTTLTIIAALAIWLGAWALNEKLVHVTPASPAGARRINLAVPAIFGLTLLALWELITRGLNVPEILLPAPSAILAEAATAFPTLWLDLVQTVFKEVLPGYLIGCGLGFVAALLIDRSPFLKAGLLPLGNFISALPIIGIAPIMIMWFGFEWPSKAAVIVLMIVFPMLINTVAGLSAAGHMERDLMRTYAASWWQTMVKLRLPAAWPFIFNALKINSTLALIGAIVAEFFGSPSVGIGFRISVEMGRMNTAMVWAEILVAAVTGSLFYGIVALIERKVTFWHPSVRGGQT
ncbi:ABC transporter permease [Rhizobium sp. NRK18]|uniref:ABC transporter permease n=1 Tax=Rhizobium sp. NRK18 TaxID=2964667 RepID=UPI0021C28309|nr:ABC transporter permease [Rhizobium sp. NRK18]MCQ2003447.1 ABC transporter permease [Rhizobium sp. NRK18]